MGDTRIRMYVCDIRGQLAVVSSLLPHGIRGSEDQSFQTCWLIPLHIHHIASN